MVEEGLVELDDMERFTEDDWKHLVSSIRKPGGGEEGLTVPMVPTLNLPLLSFGLGLHTRLDQSMSAVLTSSARMRMATQGLDNPTLTTHLGITR